MTRSHLPSGVTESMIPGNTPEDALDEQILDDLYNALDEAGVPDIPEDCFDALNEKFVEIVRKHIGGAVGAALREERLTADPA